MLAMFGLPRPDTGSHPAVPTKPMHDVALYCLLSTAATQAGLLSGQMFSPVVRSWKVLGCAAAIWYSRGLIQPNPAPERASATSLSPRHQPRPQRRRRAGASAHHLLAIDDDVEVPTERHHVREPPTRRVPRAEPGQHTAIGVERVARLAGADQVVP